MLDLPFQPSVQQFSSYLVLDFIFHRPPPNNLSPLPLQFQARHITYHELMFCGLICGAGMNESGEFADELFDALARRRCITTPSISLAELRDFWQQITDTSFDARLQTFFDM